MCDFVLALVLSTVVVVVVLGIWAWVDRRLR